MSLKSLARNAALTLIGVGAFAGAANAQGQCTDKEMAAAIQEVKQVEAGMAKMDRNSAAMDAMYSDSYIDVHTSGWMYNKQESRILVGQDLGKIAGKTKVIKSEKSEEKVVAPNCDTVIETSMNMTYYEVPNPQDMARAAGTNTFDPAAMAKAAHAVEPRGPGEAPSLNPFRTRSVRVWTKLNGHWQMAASVGTTVRERTIPGRL